MELAEGQDRFARKASKSPSNLPLSADCFATAVPLNAWLILQVRTLMRSIAELKKKLVLATAQGKDHRRSAMIRAMRTRLREQVGRSFEWIGKKHTGCRSKRPRHVGRLRVHWRQGSWRNWLPGEHRLRCVGVGVHGYSKSCENCRRQSEQTSETFYEVATAGVDVVRSSRSPPLCCLSCRSSWLTLSRKSLEIKPAWGSRRPTTG